MQELVKKEMQVSELRRSIQEDKESLTSKEGDGSHAVDISAHAFRQICERLEILAAENELIYKDCINESIFFPSNLKVFVINLIAEARKKGSYSKEPSKNTDGGYEFRYQIEIKKWSDAKSTLQFTCIVENNNIKTGYFNWL